jgi:rare lipoprotein A
MTYNFFSLLISCFLLMPALQAQADPEFGIASYYDDAFHGRKTASGELYQKNLFTAAHNTLPFGTLIKVTRLDNNRSVKVKVNDRGPYVKGRIVDLSRRAADALNMLKEGQVKVKIEIIGKEKITASKSESAPKVSSTAVKPGEASQEKVKVGLPESVKERIAENEKQEKAEAPAEKQTAINSAPSDQKKVPADKAVEEAPRPEFSRVTGEDFQTYDLYKIQLMRPKKTGFGVQVAYLTDYRNVLRQIADLQGKWFDNVLLSVEQGPNLQPVYKIILGPFDDRDMATSYAENLRKNHKIKGFVVSLSDTEDGNG